MKIQLFKNMKGLIHGGDPKRIGCEVAGTLKIGTVEISISPEADSVIPLLFGGYSGDYRASFTDSDGRVYELEKVAVREGRIAPPPATSVELMELRIRLEETEKECASLWEQVHELRNIFDTNSLNFLIK